MSLLTASFSEVNGSGTVTNNISNFNFGSIDAPNLNPFAYPLAKGSNSYNKWIYGNFYNPSTVVMWLYNPVYSINVTSSTNITLYGRLWTSTAYTAPGTAAIIDNVFPANTYQFATLMNPNNTNSSPVSGGVWATAGTYSGYMTTAFGPIYYNAQPLRLWVSVGTNANSFTINPTLTLTWQEAQ